MEGILILGHGSRKNEANQDVVTIAEMVQQKMTDKNVKAAFLSFEHPDLEEGIIRFVEDGVKKITIVPLFLFSGNHVKRDIPEMITKQKEKYPEILFQYANCLGTDVRIAEIVIDRIKEAK